MYAVIYCILCKNARHTFCIYLLFVSYVNNTYFGKTVIKSSTLVVEAKQNQTVTSLHSGNVTFLIGIFLKYYVLEPIHRYNDNIAFDIEYGRKQLTISASFLGHFFPQAL